MNYAGFDFNTSTILTHTLPHSNAVDTLSVLVTAGQVQVQVSWDSVVFHVVGNFVSGDNRLIRGMFGIKKIQLVAISSTTGHVAGSYTT